MKKEYDIQTFRQLMDVICYDWDYSNTLKRSKDGKYYYLNKTSISKDGIIYKTEYETISPEVFNQLEIFYKLFFG